MAEVVEVMVVAVKTTWAPLVVPPARMGVDLVAEVVVEEEEKEAEEVALHKASTSATTCTTLSDPTASTSVLAPTGVLMPVLALPTIALPPPPSTDRAIDRALMPSSERTESSRIPNYLYKYTLGHLQ